VAARLMDEPPWIRPLLVVASVVLFIMELKVTSYGLLTIGGIACFFFGAMLLFDPDKTDIRIPMTDIITASILLALIVAGLLLFVISSMKRKHTAGWEGLKGMNAKACERIDAGKEGKVFVNGEYWTAKAKENIEKDDEVVVTGGENLLLHINKKGQ
jgi:membrane-bound serine protease (ClpP class)